MNHVDRLLIQVKQAKSGKNKRIVGFVDYDEEKKVYTASGTIWDGVNGSGGDSFYYECPTPEEAIRAFNEVVERCPNAKTSRLFIDDMTFPDGVNTE